jgi:glycosyltransferase involved in cell wall biosynthesis
MDLSIVIPAKNESLSIGAVVLGVREIYPSAEVIVVDDGSSDETAKAAATAGAKVISHPYSKGNGAAIKAGARSASGRIIVFMDGDGQHDVSDISRLLERIDAGYDMVVGARQNGSQASRERAIANGFYNRFASWMVNQKIPDLTSGFRVVRREAFLRFLYLLPNGFSYPTTTTMAFFRAGLNVGYVPIHANKRQGKSHIKIMRDGLRFLLIIFKIGTLYSPLKIFLPASLTFFFLGVGYYAYTYLVFDRFTNMSALLFMNSVIIFLIGLVSEQITNLTFSKT